MSNMGCGVAACAWACVLCLLNALSDIVCEILMMSIPSFNSLSLLYRMVPHKTKRGAAALERLKCFDGVPAPYDKVKRLVVPDALKALRLQQGHRFCKLGALSAAVGWKHQDTLKELEAKRKVKSAKFYEAKKKLAQLRAKAASMVK